MPIKQTWAARLAALTLGTALACGPGVALADEEPWGLDGEAIESAESEAILGEAPEAEMDFSEAVVMSEDASQAEELGALQVNTHSQEEIKDLFKTVGLNLAQSIDYEQAPSSTDPFSAGQLSEETITQATGLLNLYRYVAGLDASVIPNAEYGEQSQAAALLMAADEDMSHGGLARPEGMSDELYELGSAGCARSNIAAGYFTLQDAIMGWVDDSSSNNIASVGHRRWILNPVMGQTGFGAVSAAASAYRSMYSAMYAFDSSNSEATQTMVAWPAQNTPVELVGVETPWSISFDSMVDETSVHVQVKSLSSGKVWNFSSDSADGDFYVSNAYYGSLAGCVVFRPSGIDVSDGQSYEVTVTGVDTPVQYRTNFFYMTDALTSITVNGNTLQSNGNGMLVPSVTVKSGDTVLVEGEDYELSMRYDSETVITVTAIGINNYHGEVSASFTPDRTDNGHVTIDKNDPQLPGRWVSSQGKWWYQYIDGTFPKSTWASIGGKWYFFDSEGWMLTGWQQIDGRWYYLNSSGAMQIGWQNVGGTWYYFNDSGIMQTGWTLVKDQWYYLESSGAMATGWKQVDGAWYYLNNSGAMQTGWQKIGGVWYYMNASGAMLTGWQSIGGAWYYLKASGAMATGWENVGGTWYYLNSSGVMQTGWQAVGGKWYYMDASGAMQANRWIGNYYVTASGAMATNTWIGIYHVDDSGLWDDTAE